MNKNTQELRVALHQELYDKLKKKCKSDYKTISEVIRDLVLKYTRSND